MKLFVGIIFIYLLSFAAAIDDEFGEFGGDDDEFEHVADAKDEFEIDEEEVEIESVDDFEEVATNQEGITLGDPLMDHVDDEFDDEEFENRPVDNFDDEDNQGSDNQPPTFISPDKIPESKRPSAPVYVVEYFMGACLVAYVMNYIFGRITNGNIAQQWFENARSFLESQFALVGDSGEATTESSLSMMREADHIFTLWCSGRTYMEGMLVTLKMIKRQDVFSQVNQKFVTPSNDRMIVKITLDKIDPMALVIGRAHSIREIAENYPDINYFCGEKIRGGDKYGLFNHSVLAESADALQIFDKKSIAVLNGPVGDALISLHVSDQFQGARVPEGEEMEPITKSLILVFDMIDTQIASNQCIKFSVYLADQINKFNLSREGMEKHKKRRAKRDEEQNRLRHMERQEELAKKREEQRRDQYQQMIEEEDPAKQKKLEIELQRKDQKRTQRKAAKMKHMKIRA